MSARPLNVRDALAYLEEVKRDALAYLEEVKRDALTYLEEVRCVFVSRPDVYNHFLDIMEDFKSHNIGTPAVIERVSSLFEGHPSLIVGFNSFLPPGYTIESDPAGDDSVRIISPTSQPQYHPPQSHPSMHAPSQLLPSTALQQHHTHGLLPQLQQQLPLPLGMGSGVSLPPIGRAMQGQNLSASPALPPSYPLQSLPTPLQPATASPNYAAQQARAHSPLSQQNPQVLPTGTLVDGSSHDYHSTTGYNASTSPNGDYSANNQTQGSRSGHMVSTGTLGTHVPSSHSVLSQIQPHTSPPQQQPLQSRPPMEFDHAINHAINYVNKIKNRYANEPDIYRQFLDILQTYQREQRPIHEMYTQMIQLFQSAPDLLDEFKHFMPETASLPLLSLSPQLGHTALPSGSNARLPPVGNFIPLVTEQQSKSKASVQSGDSAKKRKVDQGSRKDSGATLVSNKHKSGKNGHREIESPELEFFARLKKRIGNQHVYNEFLKLLHLYSQDIISLESLVNRADAFVGSRAPDLLKTFKEIIRYEEPVDTTQLITLRPAPAERESPFLGFSKLDGRQGSDFWNKVTTSYRKIPASVLVGECSGRDALCREVLNDHYVCHPPGHSGATDGEGEQHKKNIFEEALFKVEEERYEFDVNLEANMAAIRLLEPIAQRLVVMPEADRNTLKLEPGLGSTAPSIYRRVVRKLYGDSDAQILDALHSYPVVAVPIVLKRMKEKNTEWKRQQRELSKMWRSQDSANFYKALDYQATNFRNNDRRLLNSKQLVQEIETIAMEHKEKQERARYGPVSRHHLEFCFSNNRVLDNCLHLLQSQMPSLGDDKEKVQSFMDEFVRSFFLLAWEAPSMDVDTPEKGTLDTNQSVNTQDTVPVPVDTLTASTAITKSRKVKTKPKGRCLFGNNNIYLFLRLFQMMYSKLDEMEQLTEKLKKDSSSLHRTSSMAVQLGYQQSTVNSGQNPATFYATLLTLIEQLSENDIDIAVFEEAVRDMFGTSAYIVFSIDKVILSCLKQMQALVTDPKCVELLRLFEQDKKTDHTNFRQEMNYRLASEAVTDSNEPLYKFEYIFDEDLLTMQLLSQHDFLDNTAGSDEQQWSNYVERFTSYTQDNVEVPIGKPFLSRNLRGNKGETTLDIRSVSGLQLKMCINTYRLFYLAGTEDYLVRRDRKLTFHSRKQDRKFYKWLTSEYGWKRGLNENEAKNAEDTFAAWYH